MTNRIQLLRLSLGLAQESLLYHSFRLLLFV